MTKLKVFRDSIVLAAPTQSVVFKRIVKNGKELYLIKTTKCVYDKDKQEFHYEDLTKATWMNRGLAEIYLKILQNFIGLKQTETVEQKFVDHM